MRRKDSRAQTVYLRGEMLSEWQLGADQDKEGLRLTRQHRLLQAATGNKNRFAPVKDPKAILDIACTTGIWGVDEALHFRQAVVTNLDLNDRTLAEWIDIYTTARPRLRKRLTIVRADATQRLPFPDDTFDFVHGRMLATFIPLPTWPQVVAEMVRVTRPEGWIELMDGEYPELEQAPHFMTMREALMRFLTKRRLSTNIAPQLPELLQAAGAEAIESLVLRVGERANHLPKLADNFTAAAQALRAPLLETKCLTPEAFDAAMSEFRQEILTHQMVWNVTVAWGRKPPAQKGGSPCM